MVSKEFILSEIDNLKDMLENSKKLKCETITKACEEEIKQYNQVLKDLDELEELKKLMGTPIQDIMKRLKILEILKKCEDEKHSLYCVYVLNALSSGKITQDDVIDVKEWLEGD